MRDRVPGALVGLSLLAAFSWDGALAAPPAAAWGGGAVANPPAAAWGAPRPEAIPVHAVPDWGNQTSTPPTTKVMSCGGTTNPLTADTCGKTALNPTRSGFTATCGASITITGNTFPANNSDWLEFSVP